MRTFYLLLLYCIVLFKANSQPGSLDPSFGNKGIQTTSFYNNFNTLYEYGTVVLTNAHGAIFDIVQVYNNPLFFTRIAKYLPDGRLDSSYGKAGYSDTADIYCYSAVMQGDKILVAGYAGNYPNYDFALVRYTANGKLDSSFGVNGQVKTDLGQGNNDYAYAITLQGDKIIVAGSAEFDTKNYPYYTYDIALARYTADGTLDSTFGVNGKVTTDFDNSKDGANSIAQQGNKIIIGVASGSQTALVRYMTDGKLDSTFGVNGKVTTDFLYSASTIIIQDNKIITGGQVYIDKSRRNDFVLARYMPDGTLDSSFGVNGKVTTDFNHSNNGINSIVQQDDKIIAVGTSTNEKGGYIEDIALARYTADGKLDSSFGKKGRVRTDAGGYEHGNSVALQEDKIIVSASPRDFNNHSDFALVRYTADGKLDASFGKQGVLTGFFPSTGTIFTNNILQGDKIIAAGDAINDNYNYDVALARYTLDGSLDSTFGVNGKVTTDFSPIDHTGAIVLQGDRIIVAVNTGSYPDTTRYILTRYTANGALDSTFGVNGKVTTEFSVNDYANAIALQGDKILVEVITGYGNSFLSHYAFARFTADGRSDSSFGVNGKVITNFKHDDEYGNLTEDFPNSIVLQGDKILAALTTGSYPKSDFTLARFTADGRSDSSFGVNGIVVTHLSNDDYDYANAIALQEDKIIVGGIISYFTSDDYGLARYTADGKLDSSFGVNGKVTIDFGDEANYANSIVLQGDKIIVGGDIYAVGGTAPFVRLTANGTIDSTFGVNGKVITDVGGTTFIEDIVVHQNRLYAVGNTIVTDGSYGLVAAYQLEAPQPAGPTITIADVTVSESKRFAVVTVRLSTPTNKPVRVHFTTRDKTAVHNQDYIGVSGPLLFIPGVNTTFKLPIPIIDDHQQEGDEQFEIVLSNAHNATIQDSVAAVTIVDDDNAPIAKQNTSSLKMEVSPNPSTDVFNVQLLGTNLKQRASVRVYNISGRLIEQRNNISTGQSLRLGNQYKAGTYIIEVVQGTQHVRKEVIKTGK